MPVFAPVTIATRSTTAYSCPAASAPNREVCEPAQVNGDERSPAPHSRGNNAQVDRAELQAVQRPLKDRYREEPAAALITLRADGELDAEHIACKVDTGRALVEAGLHPATGGTGALACSGDMLLEALVACAGVTLRSVATSMELDVSGSVHAEGDLDFRGTLGVDREAPVGFAAIRLRFELVSSEPLEALDKLLELTERYCVVFQTLAGGVPVELAYSTS
jgi:uncharacterized OsmC-like protein